MGEDPSSLLENKTSEQEGCGDFKTQEERGVRLQSAGANRSKVL